MKILLIGPLPPPLGGVSVFLKRHKRALELEGHEVEVLDRTKLGRWRYAWHLCFGRLHDYDLVSVHVQSLCVPLILLARGLAPRTQLMDHNWRRAETWRQWQRRAYSAFLARCRELVLINGEIKSYYAEHGIALARRTTIRSPFIPPPADEERAILESYPSEVHAFVCRAAPLVLANAPRIVFYRGMDLYGLDMCVDLVAELKRDHPQIGLLFALAEVGEPTYLRRIEERIGALGIKENFHFMTGHREMWPLFKRAQLFVRPTCADGYGISVAEALHFGCPAVASDVCTRAPGTIIFRNRDREDLLRRCRQALDKRCSIAR